MINAPFKLKPEQEKELDEQMVAYMNDGASDDDLMEFQRLYIEDAKKKSGGGTASTTPSAQPQQPSIKAGNRLRTDTSLSGASSEYQNKLQQKNFVQRFNQPEKNIKNPDGSVSTHKMATAEIDGMNIAFPTIVEKNGKLVELPINEAIDFALQNNEFAEFATPQDAQSWAEGGYKNGTQIGQTTPTTQSLKTPILEDSDKLNPFNNAKPEVRKQKRDYLTESMKVDVTEKPVSTETQAPIDPVQQEQIVERGKVEEKAKNLVYQEATSNKRVDLLDDNVDAKTYGDAAIEDYFEVEKSLKMPNQEDVKIGYGLNTLKVEGFEDLNAVIAEENKYRELMKMNPKEWDNGDQEFIQQVRSKAIAKKVDADAAKLDILEENTDFDGFNKAMVDLAPERQQIEAELTKLKTGQPVDQAALDARIQAFNTQIQAVKEQTGVDDAKIEEYGKLAGNLGALSRAYEREQYSTDYSGIIREQLSEQEEKKFREKRLEFTANLPLNAATLTQKAGVYLDEFARGVSGGVGDMVVSIPQALHVLEQFATGGMDTKYDWIDKMYDSGENMKRAAEGGTGAPVTGNRKMSDMPIAAQIAYTGGNAIGSMATFMAGGALGGASKIGQLSAVFTTAFLGTEAMFYQEAIDAGMNPADASNSATILALGTAGAEMLVNDAALLGAKGFRNQFFKQVAGGVPAKEATKQFFKALGERVAFVSKRAGTEWIEEVPVQQVVEDVSKEQLNNYYGKEYFKNTFDPDVFQQNSIGALFAGGGMAIVSSTGSQHPNTERLMLEAARMSSDQIAAMYQNQQPIQQTLPDGTEITTGRPADYTVELERLKENLAGLEAHSNWGNLSEQEQAHALALTNQINNIEEEQAKMKAVRVKDAAKDEQIAAIEAELNDLFNAPKPKNELEGVRQRINQIEAARERGEILNDETKGELKTLKEKESELSSKPSFENVPVITRTAEEIEFAKNEVFDNLNKLEIGSVIENSDGEIKVVTEKSTDKKGNQLIGITTYERQSDGSLLQMTNIVWAQKNSDGKIKLEYNPHTTGTNSKGERVTVTDQITDKKIDLSKETIFTQDENGNLVRVNNQKQETKPADSLQPATESKPKTEPVVAEDGSYTDENGNTQYIPPLLPLPDTNVQAPQAQRQVNQSEANVLTMLKDSKILSPTEKQMLYKQFKRGVMSENDISKYTQVNVDDIVAGETDKWARVVLDKIKAKQIDAEEIDFIEIPETNTQEDVSKKEEKIDVTEERVDALKDVESTEKALDELDKTDHKKVHELFDSMADMGVDISRRRRMGWSESAFITDEYHKAKADGTNPELVKAVEDLLAPKTTTGTEAPVATKTGKTVAPINLPPTVVEQGEDNVNMTDTPVVPFKKAKDLLGNDREPWMFEATESERSQAQQKNTMRGSQFFPKKIRAIQNALDNGLFQQAISDGKITSIDAVKIIESAGLAVPENILTKTKQEVKPEVKKGKNSAKAQAARERAEAIRKATGGTNMIAPKLYAAALDVYADLLDTFDTVAEAIKEFRKTKEYQALEQGDRDEIENEIAEPTVESTEGETRETRRKAKREGMDNSPAGQVIKSLSNEYNSIDAAKMNALVESEFEPYRQRLNAGDVEAINELLDYVEDLNNQRIEDNPYGRNYQVLAGRLISALNANLRVQVSNGNSKLSEQLGRVDKFLEEFNRRAATVMAFANPNINPDELVAIVAMIDEEIESVRQRKTKSGKTVDEVVDEIVNEGPTQEEIDDAANSVTVQPPKAKAKREPSTARKERGMKKIASGLAKLKMATPTLTVLSPEKVEGLREIASGAVDLGIYQLEKIKEYVKKQVGNLVGESDVEDVLNDYWENGLSDFVISERQQDALDALAKALQGGTNNKILNAFTNAILMQDPEYVKANAKARKGMVDKVLTILKDKAAAEGVVQKAIDSVVNQSIVDASLLRGLNMNKADYVISDKNPNGMTEQEFADFQRAVLRQQLTDAADAFLNQDIYSTDFRTKDKPRRENPTQKSIAELVKEFYGSNFDNATLEQKIIEKFDISPQEAARIAQSVRDLINRKMGKRTQARVRDLVKDLNDGKDNLTMANAISRMLLTQGAITNNKVRNVLAQFLGKKGMTNADIQRLMALANQYSQMPSNVARQQVSIAMQNIVAKYNQTIASFIANATLGQMMRNILGNPQTAIVTGSLSMLKTVPFDQARKWLLRPKTALAAARYRRQMKKAGFMPSTSLYAAILSGQKHVANRVEADKLVALRRDSEWQQARETAWKDVLKGIKAGHSKAGATAFVKAIQAITFTGGAWNQQIKGKQVELSPIVLFYNLMGAADLYAWSGLSMFNLYYNAARQAELEGLVSGSQAFKDRLNELIVADPVVLADIDNTVNMEVQQMASQGLPVPKNYVHDRKKQLLWDYTNNDIFNQASFEAEKSMLLNKPSTIIGAKIHKHLNAAGNISDDATVMSAIFKLFGSSLFFFHKVGSNVVGRRGRGIPYYNLMSAAVPWEWEVRDGKVKRRSYEDGTVRNRATDQTREYAAGLLRAAAMTAFVQFMLSSLFTYDDDRDEEGNVILDGNGKPVKSWKLNDDGWIRFHGDKEEMIGNEKRIAPINSIEFTGVDDPDLRYFSFAWLPEDLYAPFYMMGNKSDELRYTPQKYYKDSGEAIPRESFDESSILLTTAMGAFDASFMNIVQGTKEVARKTRQDDYQDAFLVVVDKILLQPIATTVSPRMVEQTSQAISYMNERKKGYVKLTLKDKGIGQIATYLAAQTWLGDIMTDGSENKITMTDPHGKEVEYDPGPLLFVPALMSEDIEYGWANNIKGDKLYDLYKDGKGNFDEGVIAPPTRVSGISEYSPELQDAIKKESPIIYGRILGDMYDDLIKMPFEIRAEEMKYIHSVAVFESKVKAGLEPNVPRREIQPNDYTKSYLEKLYKMEQEKIQDILKTMKK